MKGNIRRFAAAVLSSAVVISSFSLTAFAAEASQATKLTAYAQQITAMANGWNETAYIEWLPVSGTAKYEVYVKKTGGSYTKIDDELIREYDTYWRADAVGLSAGSYQLKVSALDSSGNEIASCESGDIAVKAHDRSGVSFSSGSYEKGAGLGAYKADGTLKDDAVVLYITDENKNTITYDVITNSNGTKTTGTGLGGIIKLFEKGYETRPFCFRFVGELAPPYSDSKFKLDVTDEEFHAGNNNSYRILDVKDNMKNISSGGGITFEGIGNDTILHFNFNLTRAKDIEVRNLGFKEMTTKDEDGVTVTSNSTNWWVHNCDFFYGGQGSDKDQAKGDGSVDFKNTPDYGTVSYNHFWDTGKTNLGGLGESKDYNITMHHNWFDHSDSRHPRTRNGSYHIYNNYYDGNAKYGVGMTSGGSAFVENNYFRNVNDPMLISMQGTDALGSGTFSSDPGGIIKVYNNILVGNYKYIEGALRDSSGKIVSYNQDADGYSVDNRSDTLPSSLTCVSGGTSYNNFDTTRDLNVELSDIDPVDKVPSVVMAGAGRCDTGSFKFEFNDAFDDTDYSVNQELKTALDSYHCKIVSIGGTVSGKADSSAAVSSATGIDGNTVYADTAEERQKDASKLPTVTQESGGGSYDDFDDDDDTEVSSEETTEAISVKTDNESASTNNDVSGISVTYDQNTDTWTLTDTSSSAAATLEVPFEPVSKGLYLARATVTPNVSAGKWSFFQLRGKRADGNTGEIIGIAGDDDKNLAVRTYANGSTTAAYSAQTFGKLTGTDYNIEILVDFENQTAAVTINGKTITVTDINAAELNSYFATTASKATDRTVKIKGFSIAKIISYSGYLRGDIDRDGNVTATDAALLTKMANGEFTPDIDEEHINYVTDTDGDGSVTKADADETLKKALNNEYVLPAANNA